MAGHGATVYIGTAKIIDILPMSLQLDEYQKYQPPPHHDITIDNSTVNQFWHPCFNAKQHSLFIELIEESVIDVI